MRKMKDISYDKTTKSLMVHIASVEPNIKGARAKGQKFLKLNGVYDGMLFFRSIKVMDGYSIVNFDVSSYMLFLKGYSEGVKL